VAISNVIHSRVCHFEG